MTSKKKLLTETELELMTILWQIGEGTVRDVMAQLPKTRELAYTSASTIIRILEQKEFVKSRKEGKTHIYKPKLSKSEYEGRSLNHLVKNVFDNTPSELVRCLVNNKKLSDQERSEIKRILEEDL